MTTIYVVTAGAYSDYHIVGVYSTMELAERCKEAVGADEIEEYELDSGEFRLYDLGYKYWRVLFSGDTTNAKEYKTYNEEYPKKTRVEYNRGTKVFGVCLYAKDEKHAVKIASEIRAQVIANGVIDRYFAKMDEETDWRPQEYNKALNDFNIEELEAMHKD